MSDTAITKDEVKAAFRLVTDLGIAIKAAGPTGVASGVLYSIVMGRVDLAGFERAIDLLVRSRVVRRAPNHLLVWSGQGDKRTTVGPGRTS